MMTRREAIGVLGSMSVGGIVRRGTARLEQAGFILLSDPERSNPSTRAGRPAVARADGAHRCIQARLGRRGQAIRGANAHERLGHALSVVPASGIRTSPARAVSPRQRRSGDRQREADGPRQHLRHARLGAAGEPEDLPVLRRRPADRSRVGQLRTAGPGRFDRARHPGARCRREAGIRDRECLFAEFPIDQRRIYVMGQSMGGAGVWHMTAERPRLFAAAVACCGSASLDKPADSRARRSGTFTATPTRRFPCCVARSDRRAAQSGSAPVAH